MSHACPPPRHPPWLHRSTRVLLLDFVVLIGAAGALLASPAASRAGTGSTSGFVENRGQLSESVPYAAPGPRTSVFFTAGAVVLDLHGAAANPRPGTAPPGSTTPVSAGAAAPHACAVWVRFAGANPAPRVEARGRLGARYNFFLGNDPTAWRAAVPAFTEIVYHDLWPGIDLVFRREDGELRYEVHAGAGADPEQVRFRYDGADAVTPGIAGVDRIDTAAGTLLHRRAVAAGGRAGAFGRAAGEGVTTGGTAGAGGGPDRDDPTLHHERFDDLGFDHAYRLELGDFVKGIEDPEYRGCLGWEEGLRCVEIMEAADRSAVSGGELISLPVYPELED